MGGKFDPALREFVAEHEKEFKCTPESESQRKFTREGVTLHRQKKQRQEKAEIRNQDKKPRKKKAKTRESPVWGNPVYQS